MRIFSWNVNGLRSAIKKGFFDWLEKTKPDILNLQEIRVEWEQLETAVQEKLLASYDICWFPASAKKGYAGAATLSKKGLGILHHKGLGIEDYDREGRIIVSTSSDDFTLIAGYFPNAGHKLVRLGFKRRFSRDLTKIIEQRHKNNESLIVVGDLNVAPEEIDLAHPKTNRRNPGFTDEEREDFQGYLRTGLVDIFRQKHPGESSHYTWWSQRTRARARNVGWRIDIFLLSPSLLSRVKNVAIHSDDLGSDHCPISLTLGANNTR